MSSVSSRPRIKTVNASPSIVEAMVGCAAIGALLVNAIRAVSQDRVRTPEMSRRVRSRVPEILPVRDAAAKLDLRSGPAASTLVPGFIRYDERGRRDGATPIIVQWQDGEPFTIAPTEFGTRKPIWPGRN